MADPKVLIKKQWKEVRRTVVLDSLPMTTVTIIRKKKSFNQAETCNVSSHEGKTQEKESLKTAASRKRKIDEEEEEDYGFWTSEVAGIKIKFKRIKQETKC